MLLFSLNLGELLTQTKYFVSTANQILMMLLTNLLSFVVSRNLGGKLGASVIEILGVEYMGELTQFSESQLQSHFGERNG